MSNLYVEVDASRFDASKVAKVARNTGVGSVCVLPTDTNYTLACRMADREAITRIKQVRQLGDKHNLTLLLSSFSSLGKFAVVDNIYFKLLKELVPGPYTFILPATKEVPRIFCHSKRKTVGIRIVDHPVLRTFIDAVEEPMVGISLKFDDGDPISDLEQRLDWVRKISDLSIDAGGLAGGETTVLDLAGENPELIRQGIGDVTGLV